MFIISKICNDFFLHFWSFILNLLSFFSFYWSVFLETINISIYNFWLYCFLYSTCFNNTFDNYLTILPIYVLILQFLTCKNFVIKCQRFIILDIYSFNTINFSPAWLQLHIILFVMFYSYYLIECFIVSIKIFFFLWSMGYIKCYCLLPNYLVDFFSFLKKIVF